jgi:CRISPR/Cas system-associated exonuclease Cas4 (RecB family)
MTFTPLKPELELLADELKRELIQVITDAGTYSPRSRQVSIGPSELGEECTRKLAYKLLDWEKVNVTASGSWAAQVGTAIHSYLEQVFSENEKYETESRVEIRAGLKGTVDLFHAERNMVLDWKTKSPTGVKEKRSQGASKKEIIQVMTYAYGKVKEGIKVDYVGLVYLPTGGQISDMYIELHQYNEQYVTDALGRIDKVYELLSTIDVEANPQMWSHIPAVPSRMCMYCPYFKPFSTDPSVACPGDSNV